MNIIDSVIILFLLLGAVIGMKRGFTKQLLCTIGFLVILILSFYLKNPISIFLYKHLPFFKFTGLLKGVTALNIIVYEIIAFLIVFSCLTIIYRLLLFATSVFEKFLSLTIILGIPSKIIGAILGVLEHFIILFIVLYIFNFPIFHLNIIEQSKLKDPIIYKTPILSSATHNELKLVDEFKSLREKYKIETNVEKLNNETIDLFLKYDIIKIDSIDYLIKHHKIDMDLNDPILKKYRKRENYGN